MLSLSLNIKALHLDQDPCHDSQISLDHLGPLVDFYTFERLVHQLHTILLGLRLLPFFLSLLVSATNDTHKSATLTEYLVKSTQFSFVSNSSFPFG